MDPNSLPALFDLIKSQSVKGDELTQKQSQIFELKKEISITSKKNFILERDVRGLDQKIALLVKHCLSIEEIYSNSGDLSHFGRTTTFKDKKTKEKYGQLFYLLQTDTVLMSKLARVVNLSEIDNLLQTVMFTLYGNQYDEREEHLLLTMFQTVLAEEFGSATSLGSVLRANTAITRMMTTYTRRGPGQQYLKQLLGPTLNEIISQSELNLEVNPVKVYEAYINEVESTTGKSTSLPRQLSPEEAMVSPIVTEIITPRIKKLHAIVDSFLDTVVASLETIPYGIRWICKQIALLMKEKFENCTREQRCSLIGGFFLLRFVNPAIVTPQAFLMCDAKLSANARRNLTLLAKVLQNLANNVQFGGVKEYFMAPLNPVLESNRDRVNKFLESLCNVVDLDQRLTSESFFLNGNNGKQTSLNISLNEIYFVHQLLNEHTKTLAPEPNHPLRLILSDLGAVPPQVTRKENANVDLILDNKLKVDAHMTTHLSAETKFLLISSLKALPIQMKPKTIDNLLVIGDKYSQETKNVQLFETIETIRSNLATLVKTGKLNSDNDFAELRKEAFQELNNYKSQLANMENTLNHLNVVRKNIQQHNEFLNDQLQFYKAYLENVRNNYGTTTTTKNDKSKGKKEGDHSKRRDSFADNMASHRNKSKSTNFKFAYSQLEKDGIIMSSEIPAERKASLYFTFTSTNPTEFEINVSYKSIHIQKHTLNLSDLLERQENNIIEYQVEQLLALNVNLLIFLLNKLFLTNTNPR
eukprot:TRINITY_DN13309_c0_g1_i1.p1 TRINITY_DN13309_c0_g1~~TRINITY_DN13309_c0_g1_i1.p1  ORF type:complete len:755 (+),score=156.25 TRINITY_DN13309_c0_g1_i1:7-2271(+)